MKRITSFVLITLLAFVGCQKEEMSSEVITSKKREVAIPYASESVLKTLAKNTGVIDFELSRKMALYDLKDFKKETFEGKENLRLSDYPVIVYDRDNTPKFYEFIVSDKNNKNIGTITCFAKKEIPGFTAYVLPFVRDYKNKDATSYTDLYPKIAKQEPVGEISKRVAHSEEQIKLNNEAKEFWNIVDNRENLAKQYKNTAARFIRAWNEFHTIPNFNNENLFRTRWRGACGPAALSWLYRAYYPRYKGVYYPLNSDNSLTGGIGFRVQSNNRSSYVGKENPLFKDLADKCRVGYGPDPFKNATLPRHLKRAVNDIFPGYKLSSNFVKRARSSIKQNKPCVLLLRSRAQLHYVVAFGTKDRYNTYNFWFFKVRKVHTDSWVRIADNGAMTGGNNAYPYYMNTHRIVGKDFKSYELVRK